jgi:hypothetical protein
MNDFDVERMKEAIDWAERCNPIEEAIRKVGAIMAPTGDWCKNRTFAEFLPFRSRGYDASETRRHRLVCPGPIQ